MGKSPFVSDRIQRIELPAKKLKCLPEDAWIEIKQGVSAKTFKRIADLGNTDSVGIGYALIQECIVGWSWERPVNKENVEDLDIEIIMYALDQIGDVLRPLVARDAKRRRTAT